MGKQGNRPPSQRQLKVGEELRHVISAAFMRGDFYTPDTHETIQVTISEVRISPDLRNATVFVMPLGGKNVESTMESLAIITPHIRGIVSKNTNLRYTPALIFRLDETFDRASYMESVFNKPEVQQDLG